MICNANTPTNLSSAKCVPQNHPAAPLQAEYKAFLAAPIPLVFDAVADHDRFCRLVPDIQQVRVCQSEQGLVRRCDFGNDMIVDQRIVLYQPPSVFAYAITTPNPLGVRQHYAVATCKPHENGTHLCWQHYYEHDDLAAMLSMLNVMFGHVVSGLINEFGGYIQDERNE